VNELVARAAPALPIALEIADAVPAEATIAPEAADGPTGVMAAAAPTALSATGSDAPQPLRADIGDGDRRPEATETAPGLSGPDSPDAVQLALVAQPPAPASEGRAEPGRTRPQAAPSGRASAARVVTDRLPRIGDTAPAASPEAPASVPDLPQDALSRNAVAFDAPAGKPLMSIVLLDEGGPLIDLPLPVTMAIDSGTPDAAARATAYRLAGHEVVLIPDLPTGATATDTEVALQASLGMVPQAVAIMDAPGRSFQDNRSATSQILARLGETGHGLITFPRGLNAAQQAARRADVASTLVFREISATECPSRASSPIPYIWAMLSTSVSPPLSSGFFDRG